MRGLLVCLLCVCCCSFSAFAQRGKVISGHVSDSRGEAVIGANVIEKGTTNGIITGVDGNFRLEVSQGAALLVSYIGYKAQEIAVGNQTNLRITLAEDTEVLDEVVVVGFGTAKRRDVVGSITKVGGGDLAKYPMLLTNEDYLYDDAGNPSTARYRYNTVNTDRWLEKGDFIRLRNLQLGYTLPASVSRSIGLGNVRVYAGGSNLLLFTGFQGLDPETNWEMPLPRSFNFGVSLNL
ncbi:hypothetical protein FACS1894181_07620 [Bacteroidia bacterium]|nr:hypothetical protein FACS1894181_07620 [Bacteroidia bacterium]